MHLNRFRHLFFPLFFLGVVPALQAQNRYIDSLQQLLRNRMSDSARMELIVNIGNALERVEPEKARARYLEVYEMARQKKRPYYMGMAMSGLGKVADHTDNDSAMYYYLFADSLYQLEDQQKARESRATNKASIAGIQREQSQFEAAIRTYLEAISIMEKSTAPNKWLVLGVLFSNVGSVYHDLGQINKALEYDLKSLEAYKHYQTDPMYVVVAHLYVSGDYKSLEQLPLARKHLEEAERLAKDHNSPELNCRVFSSWGSYYQKTREFNHALAAYQNAMVYANQSGNLFQRMNCNRMMGMIYLDMKAYGKSLPFLNTALAMVRELRNKLLESELLKRLAETKSNLGQHKEAVRLYQDYIRLSDSLNAGETRRRINEIENRYQAEKKQDSILALQKNNRLQQAELKQKTTMNFALIGGCILLFLLAVLSYTNFKNKNRLLVQNEKLHLQKLSELEKEKKLLAAQSLMRGQEEERSRLARDLHDGVGGLLSGVKLSMSTMKGNVFLTEESAGSFERVIQQLDQSIAELRRVSHNMMPEALVKYGLKEALENYCENLNLSGRIAVQLQTYGMEQRMEQSTEIVIYRMIQELLHNVIRHAEARKVLIQLVRENDRFSLTVEDDGKGFDPAEAQAGAGVSNIKARAAYLNGSMDIVSKKGEGTSVYIEGQCA